MFQFFHIFSQTHTMISLKRNLKLILLVQHIVISMRTCNFKQSSAHQCIYKSLIQFSQDSIQVETMKLKKFIPPIVFFILVILSLSIFPQCYTEITISSDTQDDFSGIAFSLPKQLRMTALSGKLQFPVFNTVDEQPVRLNMAFT